MTHMTDLSASWRALEETFGAWRDQDKLDFEDETSNPNFLMGRVKGVLKTRKSNGPDAPKSRAAFHDTLSPAFLDFERTVCHWPPFRAGAEVGIKVQRKSKHLFLSLNQVNMTHFYDRDTGRGQCLDTLKTLTWMDAHLGQIQTDPDAPTWMLEKQVVKANTPLDALRLARVLNGAWNTTETLFEKPFKGQLGRVEGPDDLSDQFKRFVKDLT